MEKNEKETSQRIESVAHVPSKKYSGSGPGCSSLLSGCLSWVVLLLFLGGTALFPDQAWLDLSVGLLCVSGFLLTIHFGHRGLHHDQDQRVAAIIGLILGYPPVLFLLGGAVYVFWSVFLFLKHPPPGCC